VIFRLFSFSVLPDPNACFALGSRLERR